jgi:hypothetical protein
LDLKDYVQDLRDKGLSEREMRIEIMKKIEKAMLDTKDM